MYYKIEYSSGYVWRDDQYLKSNSIKNIIKLAKKELAYLRDIYMDKSEIKKIYKRFRIEDMFKDNVHSNTLYVGRKEEVDENYTHIGKVVEVEGKTKKYPNDYDSLISAYIYNLKKDDMINVGLNNFETVNENGRVKYEY